MIQSALLARFMGVVVVPFQVLEASLSSLKNYKSLDCVQKCECHKTLKGKYIFAKNFPCFDSLPRVLIGIKISVESLMRFST